ncbi:hypothetical protein BEP19_04860 [Ammoniphilus oxalaticus]|uniref:ATP-grasp domain-containing protein n=1 Tax=Ammoniphilus oxalaticus TaxID=66863 RepID=A0A419SIC4_9BACL|nr:YheC/YheD family protein [Ammoniphilus oxalaticus]RKD23763.1 hypothetical protein BEP19_04860 [Ammoniphilus oxalaticus]
MESKRSRVQFLKKDYPGIVISHTLCRELGIENRKQVYVQLGQRKVLTRLLKAKQGERDIWFPPTLRKELVVPFSGQMHVKFEGDTIRIGPLVGILTTGVSLVGNRLVSQRASFFRHLLSAQRGAGMYYFLFTPGSVDWETKTARGYFLVETNNRVHWQQAPVPFPDVIYNRIPNRSSEQSRSVKLFKEKMNALSNCSMFNPTFFNKWSIHQRLQGHLFATKHMPETHIAPTVSRIENMLQKYGMVYLKPGSGSLGLGIIKIFYRPGNGFFCRYNQKGQNVVRRYRTLAPLLQERIPRSRFGSYLAQQGIRLIKYNGRPLDFRVHAHKNSKNEWVVAAIAAKIAGQGSVTTHVRTGGTVISGEDLLQRVFQHRAKEMEAALKDTAVRLAEAIESRVQQNIGELGFDLGIDETGHIWMFEANSRPGRSVFRHDGLREADKKSINLIVDYSRYLANFN